MISESLGGPTKSALVPPARNQEYTITENRAPWTSSRVKPSPDPSGRLGRALRKAPYGTQSALHSQNRLNKDFRYKSGVVEPHQGGHPVGYSEVGFRYSVVTLAQDTC